jgi:hypothetical protein
MRYRTSDLLCLTAFLSLYLTVFFFGGQSRFSHEQVSQLVGIVGGAICILLLLGYVRRYTIRKLVPDGIRLPMAVPWLWIIGIAVLDSAITTVFWTDRNAIGVSGSALALYVLVFLRPYAVVGKKGLVYGYALWPWPKIRSERDGFGELYALSLGPRLLRARVIVPPAQRQLVNQMMARDPGVGSRIE